MILRDYEGERWVQNFLSTVECQKRIRQSQATTSNGIVLNSSGLSPKERCKSIPKYEDSVVTWSNHALLPSGNFRKNMIKWKLQEDGTLECKSGSWQYGQEKFSMAQLGLDGVIKDLATGALLSIRGTV